jgi:hypothetical protein
MCRHGASLTSEKGPCEGRTAHSSALSDDRTMADGTTGPAQRVTENG